MYVCVCVSVYFTIISDSQTDRQRDRVKERIDKEEMRERENQNPKVMIVLFEIHLILNVCTKCF